MLTKKTNGVANSPRLSKALAGLTGRAIDRRTFLRRSGLTAGGIAAASTLPMGMVKKAAAAAADGEVKVVKSVCTHCSVGCTVLAEVQNGVWTGQEPGWDSPFNLGAHCAKGASVREHAHGERRLKYPMKLVDGKWKKMGWDEAINEIGDKMLEIRDASGPDSLYWLGSAKHNNEQAYLFRKLYAFWGSNNGDHQARICHSTTVAGVANTWGYGAMTNSYNDIHNSRAIFLIGGNPAEAHPVSLLHLLKAKEQNNAPLIVCDPRFTRTAAHADEYVRFRPGTDVALIWGILWHVFENGWEDKEFIRQRVWGMDQIRAEVAKWTPEEVERVTGVPGSQLKRVARTMANNRPGTFIWCMGGTQHTNGNNNTRAYCVMQLALGNMGVSGGGCQHLPRPRQRAGRDGLLRAVSLAAGLLRPEGGVVEALGPGLGRRVRLSARPFREQGADGDQGHSGVPLDRRRAGGEGEHLAAGQGQGRQQDPDPAAGQHQGHGVLGPCPELADPRTGNESGDGEARSSRRDRSVSDGHGRDARPQGRRLSVCRLRRSSRPMAR